MNFFSRRISREFINTTYHGVTLGISEGRHVQPRPKKGRFLLGGIFLGNSSYFRMPKFLSLFGRKGKGHNTRWRYVFTISHLLILPISQNQTTNSE